MSDLDPNTVIGALRRQVADLSWRLALTEAQLEQKQSEETDDGGS